MSANLSAIFYLISGILFILALRGLSSPETSRQGNLFGILGMIIAITVTFLTIGNFSISIIYVFIFLLICFFNKNKQKKTNNNTLLSIIFSKKRALLKKRSNR